jgi:hypothetical protein
VSRVEWVVVGDRVAWLALVGPDSLRCCKGVGGFCDMQHRVLPWRSLGPLPQMALEKKSYRET